MKIDSSIEQLKEMDYHVDQSLPIYPLEEKEFGRYERGNYDEDPTEMKWNEMSILNIINLLNPLHYF